MRSKIKSHLIFKLILLAVISLVGLTAVSCSRSSVVAAFKPAQAAGVVVAEEMAKLIPGQGQILLFTRDTSTYPNEMVEAQVKSFNEALQVKKGLTVAATVKIGIDFAEARVNPGGMLTRDQLFKALEDHPGLAGVVSLVGYPQLSPQDLSTLQSLKCVAVFNSVEGVQMSQRIMHSGLGAVIVARLQSVQAGAQAAKTIRECFNQSYVLLEPGSDGQFSPESLATLSEN